ATGSPRLAMGTEELRAGAGVPVHTHENEDESCSVMKARASLSSATSAGDIEADTTVYVPPGGLHGCENPGESAQESQAVVPSAEEVSPRRARPAGVIVGAVDRTRA